MTPIYYREANFSKVNAAIFSFIVGALILVLMYQLMVGPLGTRPASNHFLITLILFFSAVGINFSRLTILIDSRGVTVGYGLFMQLVPWKNVEKSYQDETSAVMYGGWGIRLTRIGKKWRVVYNIIGYPRVVLVLRKGWYGELAFSVGAPWKVIEIINQRAKKA